MRNIMISVVATTAVICGVVALALVVATQLGYLNLAPKTTTLPPAPQNPAPQNQTAGQQQQSGASVLPTPAPNRTTATSPQTNAGLTSDEVIKLLVPNERERAFVTLPRWQNDHYVVETAKTSLDGDGHPCCGPKITWTTNAGGTFDYWSGFDRPTSGSCQVQEMVDPTSGHKAWRAKCDKGSNATFVSDGVSWYPK